MTNVEIDTISRNRIVLETDKNFFVEAGAGSGKTTMLVSRMVAMVEAGMDIRKICAITFTKAAANEFYDRFQKLLIERSNPNFVWVDKGYAGQLPAPTEKSQELCANALQNIDLCFMGTIDSFCSMVLSEHPTEAGIPSDATILSGADAENLYKQTYVKICEGEYGERLKELARTFRTFHWNAEEVFVKGESVLMNNRNVHFNFKEGKTVDIDKKYEEDRKAILRAIQCLLEHPELKYPIESHNLTAWEKLPDAYKKLKGKWSVNFSRVLKGLNDLKAIRLLPEALERYTPSLEDCFRIKKSKRGDWLEFIPGLDGKLIDQLERIRYDASMTFLSESVPVIEKVMRDKGAMTFFDCLYYLRNMLKKDASEEGNLIRYIYDRHSYFLIDEFQDTNPMQAEVFFYLSAEHPVEKWSDCIPRNGSLFIVGDPKQSIYRFRGADVTSFLKVKKLFEKSGGDILYLSKNFRSTKTIIKYFNDVFSEMLPEESNIQSKFERIPLPEKESNEFEGIYKYKAYGDSDDPIQICKIIKHLVGNENYKVSVDGCAPRAVKYSDIMIITKNKGKKINDIMEALDAYDIPMRVEGKVPFERNEALIEIYKLYNAVADPEDKKALFDALKSKFIGSCEEEMMKFCMAGGDISLKSKNEFDEKVDPTVLKVASYIKKIKQLSYKANYLSPAALFSEIMEHYEVYRIANAENMEVLYYTLELLRNAEKTGLVVSLKDGANYLSKLLSGESDEERCLSLTDTKDCVHIANLHKVKGLEAPVVILAGAGLYKKKDPSNRIEHGDVSEGYIFSINGKSKEGNTVSYIKTNEFEEEKTKEQEVLKAEHDRLIYVGATRARNALIICDSISITRGGKESHRSAWEPLLKLVTKDIFEEILETNQTDTSNHKAIEVDSLYQKAKDECILNTRNGEEASYTIENPSHARVSSKLAEEEIDVVTITEEDYTGKSNSLSEVHRFPALLGTMTHRMMEMIVSSRNHGDVNQMIDEIIKEYRTPKNELFEEKVKEALILVAHQMRNGGYVQRNKAPQDILSVLLDADEVYCEVPFCYKDESENTIWNGIMDVIYCKDGIWHIIDYKTNIDGTNLDVKYQVQLTAYKKAFKATTGFESDAYTYHIDI